MHHGMCVTHVPWCMSGSLTRGGGEYVPGIPGACATCNFAYLVRGPWWIVYKYTCDSIIASVLITLRCRDDRRFFGLFHSRAVLINAALCLLMTARVIVRPDVDLHMMTSSNGNIFRITGHLRREFTGTGEFPAQRPVTRSFDVFLDLRPNKRLSKQWWGWWFETPSRPLWRHSN